MNTARANLDARLKAISALQISLDSERAALKTDELALDGHLTQLGSYVENIAKGDESLIQLAGFDVADERTPVGPLSTPQNLRGSPASLEGQVNLKWSRVHGAKSYIVECSTNPDGPWTPVAVSTRVSCVAANLTSGTKYWFHVRAVGAAGLSGWSDPAVKMAS